MIEIAQLTEADIGRRVLYEVAPGMVAAGEGKVPLQADTRAARRE